MDPSGTLLRPDDEYVSALAREDDSQPRDEGKINVKFVTSLGDEYRVVETPFEVPSEFSRQGEPTQACFVTGSGWPRLGRR